MAPQQLQLTVPWPDPEDVRRQEKRRALAELRLVEDEDASAAAPAGDDAQTHAVAARLQFPLELATGSSSSSTSPATEPQRKTVEQIAACITDVFNVLVLTDMELCFWPPPPATERDAWLALARLRRCSRRRALLATKRYLRAEVTSRSSSDERDLIGRLQARCQDELDELCSQGALSTCGDSSEPLSLPEKSPVWVHSNLRSKDLPGRGKGIIVSAAVSADQEVLRVPEEALVNLFSALRCEHFSPVARRLLCNAWDVETVEMAFAVVERRRCCQEPQHRPPWADLMLTAPTLNDFSLLLTWPVEAVEALNVPQVAKLVRDTLTNLWSVSGKFAEEVKTWPADVQQRLGGHISFDEFLWAKCMFDSRSVALEISAPEFLRPPSSVAESQSAESNKQLLYLQDDTGKKLIFCPQRVASLAPGIDLLNHSPNGACASPVFDPERRMLVIGLAASVKAGTEICLSYGALQNWELLMYYGFCPDDNPHDRFTISLGGEEEDEDADEDGDEEAEGARASETSTTQLLLQLHSIPTDHLLRPPSSDAEVDGPGLKRRRLDSNGRDDGDGNAQGSWSWLGILPPQLLRCLRVMAAEDADFGPEMDLAKPPGGLGSNLALDQRCFALMQDLLESLTFEPLPEPPLETAPLWWPACGEAVQQFRASQRTLLMANLAALSELRSRLSICKST
eukprot:TRINITY_DN22226_c0_g1_i1.p1 TRINITY_DN22226_c0_g1~~TRINITY_DN22226_c0_g1_i1.p1  ORF type:complete len:700 (+),score=112.16 TRINITY_DN22226_c0_g1_i1:54-2102(+)